MIYSNVQPHRRNATSLNPTFQTRAQQIAVTAETLVEVWNPTGGPEQQGAWEEVEESLVQRSFIIGPNVFIDPATMQMVIPETSGAISAVGLMRYATGRQIGLASLDEGAVYDGIATILETYAQVNNLIGLTPQ